MEVAVPDLAGSLGGGGRYDGLIGMFSRRAHPGVRLLAGPRAHPGRDGGARTCSRPRSRRAAADVMVTLFEGEPVEEALRLAAELRAAGFRVDVYPEPDKLGKQFKYAAARGVRFVTVVGGDERARGEVTIKNMETGEQAPVPRAMRRGLGSPHASLGTQASDLIHASTSRKSRAHAHLRRARRAAARRPGRRAARLGAPGARPRLARLHRPPRPSRHDAGRRARQRRARRRAPSGSRRVRHRRDRPVVERRRPRPSTRR